MTKLTLTVCHFCKTVIGCKYGKRELRCERCEEETCFVQGCLIIEERVCEKCLKAGKKVTEYYWGA